jgi:hypothetical protein
MEIVKPLLRVLDVLTEKGTSKDLGRMHSFVIELEREAMVALEKADLRGQPRLKRKRDTENNNVQENDRPLAFGDSTSQGYTGTGRGTLALVRCLVLLSRDSLVPLTDSPRSDRQGSREWALLSTQAPSNYWTGRDISQKSAHRAR